MFPIQRDLRTSSLFPRSIPWHVAESAYEEYVKKFGREQSLERLAERGGFGWEELGWLLSLHLSENK